MTYRLVRCKWVQQVREIGPEPVIFMEAFRQYDGQVMTVPFSLSVVPGMTTYVEQRDFFSIYLSACSSV
jgi:hypothetical protein